MLALVIGLALVAAGCAGEPDPVTEAEERVAAAEQGVTDAQAAYQAASQGFCGQAEAYIQAIDRYGKLFEDDAATVGDVQTLGADLAAPQGDVAAAGQAVLDARDQVDAANAELVAAQEALAEARSSASATAIEPSVSETTPPPELPTASIDRVQEAEEELTEASAGITAETPLVEAAETFNSAAFALEVAWLGLFADAGCLETEQQEAAVEAVRGYTSALQKSLKTAGFYDGKVDGIYGPQTVAAVEALQQDAGLPVTGLVDRATSEALDEAVADAKGGEAAAESAHTAAVQTTLALAGYWDGPIDGVWTDDLTEALKEFQEDLGVEPTGAVDAATLAALEELISSLTTLPPPTTSPPETSEPETSEPEPSESPEPEEFALASKAFEDGDAIPAKFSCDGPSPQLSWTNEPPGTRSFAITVVDEDAGGFVHWVIWNLLGVDIGEADLPDDALQATNDAGTVGYFGPCPPAGEEHTYVFTVYALSLSPEVDPDAPAADAIEAIEAAGVRGQAELTGVFPG
jgi:Raf kinase inhibitor-like YbhB/YbcL family protein